MNNTDDNPTLKALSESSDIGAIHKASMQTVKVIYKMQFGHKFYPNNNTAELLLKIMKQSCFTEDQLQILKTLGFTIEIETPQFELSDKPVKAKSKKAK